jgi:ParB/RepB/Spo0J family partition protein
VCIGHEKDRTKWGRVSDSVTGLCTEHGGAVRVHTSDELIGLVRQVLSGELKSARIPCSQIRPFKGQPRTHFDDDALQSLADSMKSIGQLEAGIVRKLEKPIGGVAYELVNGERRWQACHLAHIPNYRAVIVDCPQEVAALGVQFVLSVVANFHRENHTVGETIDMIAKLGKLGFNQSEIGNFIGKTRENVNRMAALVHLHKAVREYLEQGKVTLNVAFRLAEMSHADQLSFAHTIVSENMTADAAIHHVVSRGNAIQLVNRRRNKPSDYLALIRGYVTTARRKMVLAADLDTDKFKAALKSMAPTNAAAFEADLRTTIEHATALLKLIGKKI